MKLLSFIVALTIISTSALALIELDPNSKLIGAVVEVEGQFEIFINSRQVWQTEQRLTDGYSEEERELVEAVISRLRLCNLMESTYEPCRSTDYENIREIKTALMKAGVMVEKDFQLFMENQVK